jgi:hypothetical protein
VPRFERRRAQQAAQREERELQRLALHEASHALVHFVYDIMQIERIAVGRGVLNDSPDLSGGCFWRTRDGRDIPPAVLLVAAMAGPMSDKFYGFERDNSGDLRDARRAAEQMGGDIESILETGRRDAEALIRRHEASIRTLAVALLEARWHELSGAQVEDILRRAGVQRGGSVRAPQPGQERYYERRGGVNRPSANPDPLRKVAVFERRCDGYIT